jgi:hypothetical protein
MVSAMLRSKICHNGPFAIAIVINDCKVIQGFVIWHGFGGLGCAMLCCCGFGLKAPAVPS